VSHELSPSNIDSLGNADLAVCVLEQQPKALSAYDITRVIERDYDRNVYLPSLHVSLSTDQRFCWAGRALYGLYRHRLVPGPRNLQGIGYLFLYASEGSITLDVLAFVMRWCGYKFSDTSLLGALRRHAPVQVRLGGDPGDARAWFIEVPDDARMRRHLEKQHFALRRGGVDAVVARCRSFIDEAKSERQRRLASSSLEETEGTTRPTDGNYAPTGDLTLANYRATLAIARANGRSWRDGSSKPIVHILLRRGARWADRAERSGLVRAARRAIFGGGIVPNGSAQEPFA
jgi:hypothetical protein